MKRIVEPELLDTLPPDDSRAIRSRRDLRRVNWRMGNYTIMANALRENFSGLPKQITELGAGDGDFLLRVAQKLNWPDIEAVLLDRQKAISAETLAAFPKMNWRVETIIADAFQWDGAAEIVIANMFLHHFENPKLAQLLQKIFERANLFVAVEPRRSAWPLFCSRLLWMIGCNGVTCHDATISVRAGFLCDEISALWPDKNDWQLTEQPAGLFSHLFIARRLK